MRPIALDHAAGEVRRAPHRVVGAVEVGGMGTPLGPPQAQVGAAVAGGHRAQVQRGVAVGVRREEVDRYRRPVDVDEQLVDPRRRRGRRSADRQGGVDGLDGADAHVVQAQVLVTCARPEHLEVGLVPDLEPPGANLVIPVALDEVGGEVADELLPPVPVLRRRDDRPVMEHGPIGVAGQVAGHEADLDDRAESEFEDTVVDPVDPGEVDDRLPIDLAVDAKIVVKDGMGAHGPHPELVVSHSQGLGELVADVPAAVADPVVELGKAFGADHRPPRPVERSDDPVGEHANAARSASFRQRRGGDRRAGRLIVVIDGGDGGDPVPRLDPDRAGRVGERRVGYRAHPRFADLQRGVLSVSTVGPADEIAGSALDRFPVERDLPAPRAGDESQRRCQPRPPDIAAITTLGGELLPHCAGARGAPAVGHFNPVVAMPWIT